MPPPISASMFTAGAVPVTNEKGETTMQKVKVTRYVSGKRPAFAPSDDEYTDEDEFIVEGERPRRHRDDEDHTGEDDQSTANEHLDPRLQRLRGQADSDEETDRSQRYRRVITEPEILPPVSSNALDGFNMQKFRINAEDDSDDDDEKIAQRRALIREKALQRQVEEEVAVKAEEEETDEDDSEYEDGSGSEDEANPRLKPVFVRRQDRVTLKEREEEEKKQILRERAEKRRAEERKVEARRIVEQEVKREMEEKLREKNNDLDDTFAIPVVIDNEDPEAEYEAWKVRELTRIKRDRDERDTHLKEQAEVERLRNLTEEERLRELANKPKVVTNQTKKGKMKFLQKYYHRGVFYLDQEKEVYTRDYTAPTLEDHHDKAVLPKVMQVKNFGRAGRTKYTHLVDQDTTKFDSVWTEQNTLNVKYYAGKAGGTKQVFERPSAKRRKT
ncbi:hypothetical protein RvY_07821 [Ramazzottius varieornatus]|uniref:Micro-fibrillar-associated protein 1 C-terminal domain-containing protein n=1 Tax=Ramazzottius varieornatus TaxID=947166 RepID=A0A1D1V6G8_RAMVA|nr:hypothetical protein RvY_07821 [Ramazzottius varieornatus]